MMNDQSGLCLICNAEMTVGDRGNLAVHVDHNHEDGHVRGLLCARCNNGLGCFQDDPELMVAAAAYIMRDQMIHKKEK